MRPDIAVMILAGGTSSRFGAPKGLARLNGKTLIKRVHERLKAQTRGPIGLNAAPDGPYGDQELDCIADRHDGQIGPLAGIYTAMEWAKTLGYSAVITAPVDLPFLPMDFVEKLRAESPDKPVIASSKDRLHPVCGLWPASLAPALNAQIGDGLRAAHAWAKYCQASNVSFPQSSEGHDPFFNINTPEHLKRAEAN